MCRLSMFISFSIRFIHGRKHHLTRQSSVDHQDLFVYDGSHDGTISRQCEMMDGTILHFVFCVSLEDCSLVLSVSLVWICSI